MSDKPSKVRRLRLVPVTIGAMGVLLVLKTVDLATVAAAAWPAGVKPLPESGSGLAARPTLRPGQRMLAAAQAPAAPPGAATPGATTPVAAAAPAGEPQAGHATPPKLAVQTPTQSTAPEAPAAVNPVDAAERSLLEGLRARRGEIEGRERALAEREALLAASERRLNQRLEEMQALQDRLQALEKRGQEREEGTWTGLVKLYETMRPRDAAEIMNDLDLEVLVQVVRRMKEAKAAPVMAAMMPEKARTLTAELARIRGGNRLGAE